MNASHLDLIAVGWFLLLAVFYKALTRIPSLNQRSIVGAVQAHRVRWMQNMAERDNRVLDAVLLTNLSQGNAFFASTAAIAIGGLAALLGSGEKVAQIIDRLPYTPGGAGRLYEIKLLFLMSIFIYAFFKFAWAFRLSHYVAIMIGSTPPATGEPTEACRLHAERTARLVGIAAEHTNGGIRAFYYAIAGIAWFFHPIAFMVATAWIVVILLRRDHLSRSRKVLLGAWP